MMMNLSINLYRLRCSSIRIKALALQHSHYNFYGQYVHKLVQTRHYVQAPNAHPMPDDRPLPSQQEQQDLQPQAWHPHQEQQTTSHSSKHSKEHLPAQPGLEPGIESSRMSGGVDMPYNIDWIFPRLRRPSKFWYFASQIVITAVGLFSKLVLVFMNRTRVYNKDRIIHLIAKRPKGVPLVTVSNHYSCFDDPGIWGLLPVSYVCNTFRIRWSMAAHDICFTNKYHSLFFMYGKCIPVVRGLGVYQDAINLCIEKCAQGHWVHVFPEGKVNMAKEELRLKWGVGRIIYESPKMPIVVPMWHLGMDEVLPNVEPYMLKWRKNVTINIGRPLDLNEFVEDLKTRQVPEPVARKLITDKIQEAFQGLRIETEQLHSQRS